MLERNDVFSGSFWRTRVEVFGLPASQLGRLGEGLKVLLAYLPIELETLPEQNPLQTT